ncbi:MAG: cyclase family protein [Pseudomonadota bacterium]
MARRIIDLTTPIRTDHFRWRAERKVLQSHEAGDIAQVTWIGTTVHGFTHVDSERHFSATGPTFDDMPLERYMGPAAVVDVSSVQANAPVTGEMVAEAGGHVREGDIVLMRSGWDTRASLDSEEFWTTAPYMTAEACRWLLARKIGAIAFDFPQDYCIRDYVTDARRPAFEENTTHIELLLKGIPMFEYLCNMMAISRPRVEFVGLPLKLPECDGSPIRAVAVEESG